MPLRFSHLIFDVDGTLLDPQIGMLTQFAVMFREFGYAVEDKESLRWSIGPPIRPTIKQLLNNANDETVELALARYRELFEEFGIHQVRLYPNVHEVLTSLSEAGYHLYIATSRSDYLTDAILELTDLKRHFRGVHAPTPEGEREDKASLLKHLLELEGIDPTETAMIGDRKFDIEGARANGIFSIGVLHGFGSEAELKSAGADVILNDLQSLQNHLSTIDI